MYNLNTHKLGIPSIEVPTSDFPDQEFALGTPPREIDLDPEDEKKIEAISLKLSESGLTREAPFRFFNEWQSGKQKSVKRFVLSLSFVITLSAIAGADITDINIFGTTVQDGREPYFFMAMILVLCMSFWYYEFLRKNDSEVQSARNKVTADNLESGFEMVSFVESIVEKYNIRSAEALFDDFSSPINDEGDYEAYLAIKYYQNNLDKPNNRRSLSEWMELWLLRLLVLFSGSSLITLLFLNVVT